MNDPATVAGVTKKAWETVLPIPEIIKLGTDRGFKLSGESRPLAFTLVAVAPAALQVVVLQIADLTGQEITMICGTVEEKQGETPAVIKPPPPILIFLFDCWGVKVLRGKLDENKSSGKSCLEIFENSKWVQVWVES